MHTPLHALWKSCNLISDHPRGLQVLLGHFCVDVVDTEKKWIVRRVSFAFHRWVILALAQRSLVNLERPWSTH